MKQLIFGLFFIFYCLDFNLYGQNQSKSWSIPQTTIILHQTETKSDINPLFLKYITSLIKNTLDSVKTKYNFKLINTKKPFLVDTNNIHEKMTIHLSSYVTKDVEQKRRRINLQFRDGENYEIISQFITNPLLNDNATKLVNNYQFKRAILMHLNNSMLYFGENISKPTFSEEHKLQVYLKPIKYKDKALAKKVDRVFHEKITNLQTHIDFNFYSPFVKNKKKLKKEVYEVIIEPKMTETEDTYMFDLKVEAEINISLMTGKKLTTRFEISKNRLDNEDFLELIYRGSPCILDYIYNNAEGF